MSKSESLANKQGSTIHEPPELDLEGDLDDQETSLERDAMDEVPHVFRIVLTGGPCGGKTTALSTIADYLRSLGTQVFMVPENATIFANGGAGFPVHSSKAQQMCWESSRIMCQMKMEDCFIQIAKSSGKPTVVLCDRGTMDAAAYMDSQRWNELMEQMGWQTDILREERYDAVIHLHSTAIGAEDYYTLSNNQARREGLEQAAELDHKIATVWKGHPHVEYIDNSTDFPQKIIRVVEAICRILGMHAPTSSGFFKVYGISRDFKDVLPRLCIRFEEFFVQTDFLKNSSAENNQSVRVRRQRDHSCELSLYTCSSRTVLANNKVAIEERAIDAKEYFSLLKQVDTTVAPVRRWRRCFEYNDTYFQLDDFEDDQLLLSVEVPSLDAQVMLPPWIQEYVIATDVQGNLYTTAQRLYRLQQKAALQEKGLQNMGSLQGGLLPGRGQSALATSPDEATNEHALRSTLASELSSPCDLDGDDKRSLSSLPRSPLGRVASGPWM
eukprot:GGOE01004467.1.p1 GENE.GGOE01004467.1~~GGOE01004467.1.p1  ORF type:complete len:535 (-),score=194.43 GGOE01004467.1:460-1953(-)